MTRKDFQLLSRFCKRNLQRGVMSEALVKELASELDNQYGNFKEDMFLVACGL